MRSISIKALLASNIAEAILIIGGIFLVSQIGIGIELAALGPGHLPEAIQAARNSATFIYIDLLLYAAACCAGGAIAAWMAEKNKLLHGALSSILILLSYLYPSDTVPPLPVPEWFADAVGYAAPLFGIAGAYLATRFDWRIAIRWILAFAAMIVIYFLGSLLAERLGLSIGRAFACALAIAAGVSIMPTELRKQALIRMVVVAIAVPIAILLWRLAAGGGSVGNILLFVYNLLGVVLAQLLVRRLPGSQ